MANSKKRCKHCKEFVLASEGMQAPCGFFCSFAHASAWASNKVKTDKEKAIKKDLRERKIKLKTHDDWMREAQAIFNKWIRLRDYNEDCISCDKTKAYIESAQGWKTGGAWDAGHFKSRGAKGQLRFNVFNVHKQCKSCNGGSGKFSKVDARVSETYEINLTKKIGKSKVEALKNNNELRSFTIDELIRIKKIYTKRFKNLKKIRGIT